LIPTSLIPKIIAKEDRQFQTWKGGQIFGYSSGFDSYWIKRKEYDEVGASVYLRKII